MATDETHFAEDPYLTGHAEDQWGRRALNDDVCPYSAWSKSIRVQLPHPWGKAGDEARFHPKACVVLCRRGHAITTVYDIYGPEAHDTVRNSVEDQLNFDGPGGDDE